MMRQFLFSLYKLGYTYIFDYVVRNLFAVNHYYVLYLHLYFMKRPTHSRLSYQLRTADDSDFESLMDQLPQFDLNTRKELLARLFFHQAGFQHCFLAKLPNGQTTYMQWLIYPEENEVIANHFTRQFYPLRPGQVMLENAFTFPRFRGMGLLPAVSAQLLILARDQGYKDAIVYIKKNQIASLNEFIKLGFTIRKMVREYKILGITKRML